MLTVDPFTRKLMAGFVYGTVREMRKDGNGDIATEALKEAREKIKKP